MRSLAWAAGLLFLAACSRGSGPDFDLILVSVDTLRADRMSLYGADRATDLTVDDPWSPPWLAARGTTWESCWAPAGKTIPSLATLFTGLEPLEHGALAHVTPIQGPSFAERLREEGFRTFARVANRSVTEGLGFARGFEDFAIRAKAEEPRVGSELLALARPAIEGGERLLLWAHYMAPHQPYAPPKEYGFSTESPGPSGDNATLAAIHREPSLATAETVEHLRTLYDGEVRYASSLVAQFLAGLDQSYRASGRGGLLDNAVVVLFSDHGEELGDRHGYFLHAKSLYSAVIRVPLVIAGVGIETGTRSELPIALADVLPWLVDGQAPERSYFVASWQGDFFSIRDRRWTLVHSPCDSYPDGPREPPQAPYPYPEVALFDRSADPLELRDVAAEHPEETRRLLRALNAWYETLVLAAPRTIDGVDPDMLEELGYADGFTQEGCTPWPAERWRPD